jgi:type IV secretory pathway VirJ component
MKFFPRVLALALLAVAPLHAESIAFGRFGALPIHRPSGAPTQLVLLVAGAPHGAETAKMARSLSASGAVVAVVNLPRYLAAAAPSQAFCSYPSADLEGLGRFLTKKLALSNLPPPTLAGDATGGGLAYAALAQSPAGTFSGLLTLGFCPRYDFPRPLCGGNSLRTDWNWKKGGVRLRPEPDLDDPWVALDVPGPACEAGSLQEFATGIKRAAIVPATPTAPPAPAASDPEDSQIRTGFDKLVALHEQREKERVEEAKTEAFPDLPIVEVPGAGPWRGRIAILITGDGGYVGLDDRLGNRLSGSGVPVAAIDSLNYFWKTRTPESATADLVRILDHYLAAWKAESALLLGYSQGADVLPFLVERLPERLLAKIAAVALVGPDSRAIFDFQFGNYMAGLPKAPDVAVAPQIAKVTAMKGVKLLCVYAERETDSLCRKLPAGQVTLVPMPGGHGYSKATAPMVNRLLTEIGLAPSPAPEPATPEKPEKSDIPEPHP